uniref:Uncharacterized protein n=1 Tax=Mastacembelus armatus TaxID=205130 RepID=A0A7N8YET6_9TELE
KQYSPAGCVEMSAASCLLTEDQFLCSICLDVFTDPVTTSCGHNFCKNCITEHWNINVQCQCPICKRLYNPRPELQVNTFISEMAAQYKQSAQQTSREVPCDPVDNLEERMCTKHDKLMELFCKTDQMCVCMLCTYSDHKTHEVVPLKEEYEGKKAELGKTEAEIQQMIQKRQVKIEELRHSVKLSNEAADREKAEGVQVFTALKESVDRGLAELDRTITEKQRTTEKQAEGFIKELEQEISELKKRSSEVDQLSHAEDHFNLLQSFSYLKVAPPTKDWTRVSVRPPSYEGSVVRAVEKFREEIEDLRVLRSILAIHGTALFWPEVSAVVPGI